MKRCCLKPMHQPLETLKHLFNYLTVCETLTLANPQKLREFQFQAIHQFSDSSSKFENHDRLTLLMGTCLLQKNIQFVSDSNL